MDVRAWRRAAALGLALTLAPAARGRADEPEPSAWDAPGRLQQALDAATTAVEEVSGARFEARPTFKRSTPGEVRELLRHELAAALVEQGPALDQALANLSQAMFAKYAPEGHVVHVVPANAERLAQLLGDPELAGEDVMRVVIAHEVAHALDFQRFPRLDERRRELASRPEAARAVGAVIEGHAQWVAERVARRWGLEAAFEHFTRSITAVPPGLDPGLALVLKTQAAEFEFAYVRGLLFCRAVEEAQGRAGLERALADPPLTPEEIESPARWLDPARAPAAVDLSGHVAGLAGLAPGEGWQKGEQGLLRSALDVQIAVLPEADRADALAGFEAGRGAVWQRGEPQGYVAGAVLKFETAAHALRWMATTRAISKAKDAQLTTGALRLVSATYADLPGVAPEAGFRATKRLVVPGLGERDYVTLCLALGALAYEVTVFEPDAAQSSALADLPQALERASRR